MDASFLVDKQIVSAVQQGDLVIEDPGKRKLIDPVTGRPERDAELDAHGYILHARKIYSWRKTSGDYIINLKERDDFILYPGESIFIETYEYLSFSPKLCGTIHSLARLTLLGFSHISTTVHPGWGQGEGSQPLRIAITNLGKLELQIKDKEPIARLLLYKSDTAAEIRAPRPEEVFQRSEVAIQRHIEKHKEETSRTNRLVRWSIVAIVTILIIVVQPLFVDGATIEEMVKASAMTMVALWATYLFKTMPEI